EPVARQFTLSDAGRLDISFRDSSERLWVIEVKAVPIRTEVADQVYRYARKLRETHPQDPPIPAVVAPVINSTVRDHFDRWGIEYFEISKAVFRRVAEERGVEISAAAVEAHAVASGSPADASTLTRPKTDRARSARCGAFRTQDGYAVFCTRGECARCRYKSCECPHHTGGKTRIRPLSSAAQTGTRF